MQKERNEWALEQGLSGAEGAPWQAAEPCRRLWGGCQDSPGASASPGERAGYKNVIIWAALKNPGSLLFSLSSPEWGCKQTWERALVVHPQGNKSTSTGESTTCVGQGHSGVPLPKGRVRWDGGKEQNLPSHLCSISSAMDGDSRATFGGKLHTTNKPVCS